ncbi:MULTISPECIES: hypothetical protein [Eubacteriales]|uniref:hypothetical protein n=1 Tax=Eubacteriales TaxID=186802 RepID=UPI000B38854B|nr:MULTISPECIES: hypothetical protein [Oscillospiraceae]MBM6723978.1 hypothetical protein [Pseudoflavonifractor phocaeensis]OUO31810.1 hypothetical protein B5F88_17745 [Flavonifractor sp. An306]
MTCTAQNKQDTTYLGRFTFDTILDFEGPNRVLTILARGFLFHNGDSSPAEAPRERIDYAKRGLCAWCSVPDSENATPREVWQFGNDFGGLYLEFPGLAETFHTFLLIMVMAGEQSKFFSPDGR